MQSTRRQAPRLIQIINLDSKTFCSLKSIEKFLKRSNLHYYNIKQVIRIFIYKIIFKKMEYKEKFLGFDGTPRSIYNGNLGQLLLLFRCF